MIFALLVGAALLLVGCSCGNSAPTEPDLPVKELVADPIELLTVDLASTPLALTENQVLCYNLLETARCQVEKLMTAPEPQRLRETSSKPSTSNSTKPSTPTTKKPTIAQLKSLSVDELKKLNNDTYGKIRVPSVNICEPIVLTPNSKDYYRYDFYGTYDRYGTVFAQPGTSWDRLDANTVIYGHNRGKSSQNYKMFGTLTYFAQKDYAVKNPYFYLDTVHGSYKFKIFSVYIYDSSKATPYEYNYTRTRLSGFEDKNTFFNNLKSLSMYDTGVTVNGNDTIATLMTCIYRVSGMGEDNGRLVIVGKLVN